MRLFTIFSQKIKLIWITLTNAINILFAILRNGVFCGVFLNYLMLEDEFLQELTSVALADITTSLPFRVTDFPSIT